MVLGALLGAAEPGVDGAEAIQQGQRLPVVVGGQAVVADQVRACPVDVPVLPSKSSREWSPSDPVPPSNTIRGVTW